MEYNEEHIKKLLPKRPQNSHKGTFGHVLNIAGSDFYTGAAYFSSIAPLKIGCGKVTLASEENVLKSIASLCPDVILLPFNKIKNEYVLKDFQAISIGCGFSTETKSIKLFKNLIKILSKFNGPVIIDADGLNILTKIKSIKLPLNLILTPHPKELSRLLGISVDNILTQPDFWIKKCSEKYNCTTVLKLHETLISDNRGNFYKNQTGNSALSHGGSGDVLTGMITGFLAQGLNAFDSCCLAVYLHGLTGEFASKDLTEYSVLASDLLNYIPQSIKSIL